MSLLSVALILLWIVVIVISILVMLLYRQFGLIYLGSGQRIRLTGLEVGKHAPTHQLVELDGVTRELDWSAAGPGRGTMIIFGGARCPICEELLPQLNDAERLWGKLVDFVFVDRPLRVGDPERRNLPEERRWRYAFTPDASLHEAFDVEVTPYGFLVNDQGILISKRILNSVDHIAMVIEHSVDEETGMLGTPDFDPPIKLVNGPHVGDLEFDARHEEHDGQRRRSTVGGP